MRYNNSIVVHIISLSLIVLTAPVFAQQTCKEFVSDNWQESRYFVSNSSAEITVTDSITGLMWQQCAYGFSGNNCDVGSNTLVNWQQALELSETQNTTTGYAGFNDWRLPNINELRSLIAFNCYSPAVNLVVFPNTQNKWFWSSSPFTYLDIYSWKLNFTSGKENEYGLRTSQNAFRLVRSL